MAIRKIVEMGKDEILRKHSRKVVKFDHRLGVLLDDMADTMYEADGVGLAAPQVGVLKRAVVIDVGEGLIELVNPEMLWSARATTLRWRARACWPCACATSWTIWTACCTWTR